MLCSMFRPRARYDLADRKSKQKPLDLDVRRRVDRYKEDMQAVGDSKAKKPDLNTIVEEKENQSVPMDNFPFPDEKLGRAQARDTYSVPLPRSRTRKAMPPPAVQGRKTCFDSLPCRRRKLFHLPMPAGTYHFMPFYEDSQGLGVELADGRFVPLQKPPTIAEEELSKAYAFVQDQIKQFKAGIDLCLNTIEASKAVHADYEYEEKVLSDTHSSSNRSSTSSSLQNERLESVDEKHIADLDAAIDDLLKADVKV